MRMIVPVIMIVAPHGRFRLSGKLICLSSVASGAIDQRLRVVFLHKLGAQFGLIRRIFVIHVENLRLWTNIGGWVSV